jgi:hypothetical protein
MELKQLDKCMRVTPNISTISTKGAMAVVGTNTQGRFGKGAALIAKQRWDAEQFKPEGPNGKTYGIITKDLTKIKSQQSRSVPLSKIKEGVDKFIDYAIINRHIKFYVVEIGCNLAGYRVEEIAPMFERAVPIGNIYLPASFWHILID